MNKRNKMCIIYRSSIKEDKLHLNIKDKYFTGELTLSTEGIKQLKELLNE